MLSPCTGCVVLMMAYLCVMVSTRPIPSETVPSPLPAVPSPPHAVPSPPHVSSPVPSLVEVAQTVALQDTEPQPAASNLQPQVNVVDNKPPAIDMDRARFDKDLKAEKKSQYSFIQKVLVNFLQPKPIVDNIREQDKYGNDGEGFSKIGRGVVGGVSTITNFLSTAVDIPFEALKSVTRKATASLNSLGTKLIGL